MSADLILRNAAVFTGAQPSGWGGTPAVSGWGGTPAVSGWGGTPAISIGGVAVEAGRILAVGNEHELRYHAGPRTEVVDCRNGLLTPGFIDSHVHPITGGLKLLKCSLYEAKDAAEALALVAAYADSHPGHDWVWGGGWSLDWFERGVPAAETLDAAVPDRPVFLYNKDGHGAWLNSEALRRAGIDRSTPDPIDGRIERLPSGEPQGTLHEGAMDLVERILPQPRESDWDSALQAGQRYLLAFGVTGWQDADVQPPQDGAYLRAADRGELIGSVVGALWWDRHRGIDQIEELLSRRAAMAPRYRPTSVKLMLDGVAENYTASMLYPYLDDKGSTSANSGIDFIDPLDLRGIVTRLDRLGFQCHFHAIGDRAVRNALDSVEAARIENGDNGPGHHIAHIQVIDRIDLPRFRQLRVAGNAQALWACAEPQMVELTLPFLNPTQAENQYLFASLIRTGADLAMGSDWSVSTADVMQQIEVAVTRRSTDHRQGEPFLSSEALTLEEAITAFTVGSARINRVEDGAGSIEVGKGADLVLFDRNPFNDPPIGETRVVKTIVSGKVVYEARSS